MAADNNGYWVQTSTHQRSHQSLHKFLDLSQVVCDLWIYNLEKEFKRI